MKKLLTLFIFVPLLTSLTFAQGDEAFVESKPTVLGASLDYGFLIKHSESLRKMDDAYPFAISIDWSKHLLTKKAWEFCNCFPRAGVSVAYWNWDSPDVLGSGIVAMGYVEPYFLTHKRTNLFLRMDLGGTYLTSPYDEETNPNNLSYSTYVSFALSVGMGVNYRVTDELNLRLAARYNHISNGGIRVPNKGLNFPTLSLGVNKSLTPIDFPTLSKVGQRKAPEDKTRVTLIHLSGWSNASVGNKDKFYVFGLVANYSRWVVSRSALTLGTEFVADYSKREQIRVSGSDDAFQQAALLVGHEFWLGKVTFSQQLGIYYFNQYEANDDLYQRYGLTYTFYKNLFGGFNLKAHRHVADFFDFRIGVIL